MTEFAAVILVDRRGWVLLQERDDNPVIAPGKWSFSGGHAEPGEDLVAAAVRELAEETDVVLAPDQLTEFGVFDIFHTETQSHDKIGIFAARVDLTDDDIVCHEGRQIVFVDPSTVDHLDLSDTALTALGPFLESELYRELAGL